MSWNVSIYAEAKQRNDTVWHPLCEKPIFDFYKSYIDDFYEGLPTLKLSTCSIPSINGTDNNNNLYSNAKYCSYKDFLNHYANINSNFYSKLKYAYLALDLGITIDDYVIYVEEDFTEDSENNKENDIFSRLTNPVSKKLMIDLANAISDVNKANVMIGICNVIDTLADYGDEIRLVFVVT